MQKVLSAIDQGKQLPLISILEAMQVLVLSLREVIKEMIDNCVAKSGFSEDVCSEKGEDPFYQFREVLEKLSAHHQEFVSV